MLWQFLSPLFLASRHRIIYCRVPPTIGLWDTVTWGHGWIVHGERALAEASNLMGYKLYRLYFRELSFFTGGCICFWRGDQIFFQWVKGGGPEFFEGHRGGIIIYVRGCSFTRGARIFLSRPRRGPEFFCTCRGGTRIFLCMPRGWPEKLASRDHKQTPPLPVKKDSSLNRT